jgi:hypothetical protein
VSLLTPVTPGVSIFSVQGMKRLAFKHPWSVMVSIESWPPLSGSFMMKSMAIVTEWLAWGQENH